MSDQALLEKIRRLELAGGRLARASIAVCDGARSEVWEELDRAGEDWDDAVQVDN